MIKFPPLMLIWCSINTQLFAHAKSSSISHFINGKSRNLELLPRYLSGIVTSIFKVGTGGCVGQFTSPSFLIRTGLAHVFPITVVLKLISLPSESLLILSILSLWEFYRPLTS